jgi:heme exporter protein B
VRAALAIALKDLRAEFRSRELLSLMGLFAMLSVLVFSFALELDRGARVEVVGGVLWVTVIFASILGLNRGMAMEREGGGMDALLLAPIDRTAVFAGKLVGNFLFALAVGLLLLPLMSLLYNVTLLQGWVLVLLLLGTLGISTVGTLLATLINATRAREGLMPVLMLPLAIPLLITSARAANGILNAMPTELWSAWVVGVVVVDVVYLVVCMLLFGFVVEE